MREAESFTKKYEEEDLQVDLKMQGDELVLAESKGQFLLKFSLKTFKALLEKKEQSPLELLNMEDIIQKYTGSIDLKADFFVSEGAAYEYGADADGNRGEMRRDLNDVEESDIELMAAELRLIDEDGEVLGGEDFFLDLLDSGIEEEPIVSYICEDINKDLDRYF